MALRVTWLVATLVVGVGGAARADRPTSPTRLVDGCRSDPQSSLCREVRRLCATKSVRDDVILACRELGWYGDTIYRELTNLCPIDPGHARCVEAKEACEQNRAAQIAEDGAKICRELGWGEYAYTSQGDGSGIDDGSGDEGTGVTDLHADGGADAAEVARAARMNGTHGGGAAAPTARPPGWNAGVQGLGVAATSVQHGELVGGSSALFGARLEATWISFTRVPLALVAAGTLGGGSDGGVVYDGELLVGAGRWWTPHLAVALLGGVDVSGISDALPFAATLPVRLVGVAHAGERLSLAGWAELGWLVDDDDVARGRAAPDLEWADQATLGVAAVWGRRDAANTGLGGGLWLGATLQEWCGTRMFTFMVGFGAAKDPWNL